MILSIQALDADLDAQHSRWFEAASRIIAEEGGVEAAVPRVCGRSVHGHSLVVADPSQHYRITVSRPLISLFLSELKGRFEGIQAKMAIAGNIVPSVLTRALKSAPPLSIDPKLKADWIEQVLAGAKVFSDAGDLNCKNLDRVTVVVHSLASADPRGNHQERGSPCYHSRDPPFATQQL